MNSVLRIQRVFPVGGIGDKGLQQTPLTRWSETISRAAFRNETTETKEGCMSARRFTRIIAVGAVVCGLSLGVALSSRAEEPVAKPSSQSGASLEWIRKTLERALEEKTATEESLWQAISQGQEYGTYLWTWLFTSPLYYETPDTRMRVLINQSEDFWLINEMKAGLGKDFQPKHLTADRVDGGFD
jgi:hypothetical protein